ncbi:AP-1 complex subunit beta-1, partial [Podochytrium sp. JEL0797]
MPRLQHANSAVVLSAIRVVLYMTNYILKDEIVNSFFKRIGPPLVTLLHNGAEVQFVALRNIQLILQRKPDFLKNEIKVFFCKYNDPIYVKIAKLEIMFRLVNEENIEQVLPELKEYATEVDVDFVRKSIRAIGKCAIKIESSADRCIRTLVDLIKTKVNYVVQESIIVIKDIFRRYPNRYEGIITTLCENLDSLDESEAKASMIWIIGHYSDRIENAHELLNHFLDTFKDETSNVQLALLTAIVKLFIKRPTQGQELIPKVLKWSTEDVDNPDLRDRGFIYWRLLSTDPVAAKVIVFGESTVPITAEMENLPSQTLEELFLHISTLASIYHKTPQMFVGGLRQKKVEPSGAFVFRDFSMHGRDMDGDVFGQQRMPEQDGLFGDDPNPVNPYAYGTNNLNAGANNHYDDDADDDIPLQYTDPVVSSPITDVIDRGQFDMFLNSLSAAPPAPPKQTSIDLLAGMSLNNTPFGNSTIQNTNHNNGFANQPASFGPIFGRGAAAGGQNVAGVSGGLVELDPFGPSKQAEAIVAPQQVGVSNPYGMGLHSQPMGSMSSSAAGGVSNMMTPLMSSTSTPLTSNATRMGSLGSTPSAGLQMGTPGPPPALGYVAPHAVFLDAVAGKGLEITGTFSRRAGRVYMELGVTNKGSLQPLSDFAILFNRNTFGMSPAEPLTNPGGGALQVGQGFVKMVGVKVDAASAQVSNPVTNLQVAVKCSAGILYFAVQVPLGVVFVENGGGEAEAWLRAWGGELPASTESVVQFEVGKRFAGVEEVKNVLFLNNVAVIAQRTMDMN